MNECYELSCSQICTENGSIYGLGNPFSIEGMWKEHHFSNIVHYKREKKKMHALRN